MDELIKKFVSGKLDEKGYNQLFANPSYKREEILSTLFDEVIKQNGNISYEAAQIFEAVYDEYGNDRTSKLPVETLINVIDAAPTQDQIRNLVMKNISFMNMEAGKFALAGNIGKDTPLDDQIIFKAHKNALELITDNLHYSKELFELRKEAVDKTIDYIGNIPTDVLKKINPDASVNNNNLVDFLTENYNKLSDKQLLEAYHTIAETYLQNMGYKIPVKLRSYTAEEVKTRNDESGSVGRDGNIAMNMNSYKEMYNDYISQGLPEKEVVKFIVMNAMYVTIHESNHLLLEKTIISSPADKAMQKEALRSSELSDDNLSQAEYFRRPWERDSFIIGNYFLKQLSEKVSPFENETLKFKNMEYQYYGIFFSQETSNTDMPQDKKTVNKEISENDIDNDLKEILKNLFNITRPDNLQEELNLKMLIKPQSQPDTSKKVIH